MRTFDNSASGSQEHYNPVGILLEVYDDYLAKADSSLRLDKYSSRIIIDTTGFYVIPYAFKARIWGATILIGAFWPLFGTVFFYSMVRKMMQRRRMLRRCSFRCGPWFRFFMILLLYFSGSASWCFSIFKFVDRVLDNYYHHRDQNVGQVSLFEIVEPSVMLLLMVASWVHELALLRLEQSAAAQLSNELREYDVSLASSISDIPGGFKDLGDTFDLLGFIFSRRNQRKQCPIHMISGKDLYTRLFPDRCRSEVSSPSEDAQASQNTLQVGIRGERLSTQVRVTLERQYPRKKVFFWMIVALLPAFTPSLAHVYYRGSGHLSAPTHFHDQLLVVLFIPITYVATINFLVYWDDAVKRLGRLTELVVLLLYLFGTNSSRTVIGGQFATHLGTIVVNRGDYEYSGEVSKLDAYVHKAFFDYVDERLWKVGDKVNYQTIQAFLSIRKYMNTVVATERVRVQQVFLANFYLSLLCFVGAVFEILFVNKYFLSVTVVCCFTNLILLIIFLIIMLFTTVNLNEILKDATTFLLESWRENIHMQRCVLQQPLPLESHAVTALNQARGVSAVETADRALEFLIRFVEKRQVYIGFFNYPITRKSLLSVWWGISIFLLFIVASCVFKYTH